MRGREALARDQPAPHWTEVVYRDNGELFYDVEAALFQNDLLTRQEIDLVTGLADRVGARLEPPIVDLACGPGRHSRELARRGFGVTGVDLSAPFLGIARAAASGNGRRRQRFLCGDLRRLALADGSFSSALLLGNSFGYFSDAENQAILEEIGRVVSPAGLLCLELTDRDAYLRSMKPYDEELVRGRRHPPLRCQWWKEWDETTRRVYTRERHTVHDTGELVYEGPYDVRLYGWSELRRALRRAGFREFARTSFRPATESLEGGLGETFGAMSEVVFVAARR